MTFPEHGSASIDVAAPPEQVWALIADITRMGEWSPECYKAHWEDTSTGPETSARFHGYNRAGTFEWDLPCEVVECEPGRVFAFVAPAGADLATRWRFELESTSGGTRLTETFTAPLINVEGSPANFEGRYELLVQGAQTTIANIKSAAEASA
jgi:uncharacterized protein YndB with AHSA1/START domain